jgi:hypothetical protein
VGATVASSICEFRQPGYSCIKFPEPIHCLQAALGRLKKCTTKEITANINRR